MFIFCFALLLNAHSHLILFCRYWISTVVYDFFIYILGFISTVSLIAILGVEMVTESPAPVLITGLVFGWTITAFSGLLSQAFSHAKTVKAVASFAVAIIIFVPCAIRLIWFVFFIEN
jgi:hypothetical protein